MKRTTKRRGRRTFSDEQKRAILAEITPKNTAAAVARKHGLQWATIKAWRAKLATLAPAAAPVKAATNGTNGKPALQIHGLDALVRTLVVDELGPIVARELPAALERALARAYGGKAAPQ